MKKLIFIILILFYPNLLFAELKNTNYEKYFYIGKMKSHHDKFTLFFKTREKAILARGKNSNYITDYPQDLYIYDHSTKKEYSLISYEWFPKKAKKFFSSYKYPVFPEDFAYYLLNDNNTLILVSAFKNYNQNLIYDIKKKKLGAQKSQGKLNFIISTYIQNCGYKSIKNNFECKIYKPLISKNLINLIE